MKQASGVQEYIVKPFSNKRSWDTEETNKLINEVPGLMYPLSAVQTYKMLHNIMLSLPQKNLPFNLVSTEFNADRIPSPPEPVFKSSYFYFNNRNRFCSQQSFLMLTGR
jgi:hypothetical protein